MNFIHTPRKRDLHLPNGTIVKIEVSEDGRRQHVHDPLGRVHGTARPDPIAITIHSVRPEARSTIRQRLGRLRSDLKPTMGRRRWVSDDDMRLWVPLPRDVVGADK